MEKYYLKSTIKIEPYIWHWYAWSYLIPPATAACNIVGRHMKIMQSYIKAPQIHANAAKNPKLLGGPFIDYEGEKVEQVATLLDQTVAQCSELIELEAALKECDQMLQVEASGGSVEYLYERIPPILKGLVELVYDLNHQPSIRLVEALIYQKFYKTDAHCLVLSENKTDHRPFVLSTPRIEDVSDVFMKIPFCDERVDELFKLRHQPKPLPEILKLFPVDSNKQELFKSFFTTAQTPLKENRHYDGDDVRIRYVGHASVLMQTKDVSIMIDPILSYNIEGTIPRFSYDDMPDTIDYVLLSHNHQDHVLLETLLQLRHKIKHVVFPIHQKGALEDPSLKLILQHLGFKSLIALDDMESIEIPGGKIKGLPFFGEHADLNIQTKQAYCVDLNGKNILLAADSNNMSAELYDYIFDDIGKIDILFLGMECDGAPLSWLYGPLLSAPIKRSFDNSRQLSGSDFNKAWAITQKSACKQAYVYAMGQEPWLNHIMALKYTEESPQIIESNLYIECCKQHGIQTERLYGMKEWII